MEALTDALRSRITAARIFTGHTVRRIRKLDAVEVDAVNKAGQPTSWRVDHVLLAAPPRLVECAIEFTPALPEALARRWRATGTWMAPHAKYVAVFDSAFWREQGLSGEARSARGPMAEIHDASMRGGSPALFGFIGIPARARGDMPEDLLKLNCRAQLIRMFGPKAAAPQAELIKDWAFDRNTSTAADIEGGQGHDAAPPAGTDSGPWAGRLTGIGSEWSPHFPGYLAGAIEAAHIGVQALRDRMSLQDE
jgi:monoamine oxidase